MVTSLNPILLKETVAPATPPTATVALYSIDGSALLMKDDAGTVTTLGGGVAVSALSAASALDGTEVLPIVQGGTTKKGTATQLQTFVQDLVSSSPAMPAADTVRMFGRKVAGKMLPAYVGPSGLDSALQASFARNKIAQFSALPGSAVLTSATGMALTATGTATAKNPAVTNLYTQTKGVEFLVTVAATTAVAGWRSSVAAYWRGSVAAQGGFFFVCRFAPATGPSTASTWRSFTGMSASTAAPTDVQPSSLVNMCGMAIDAADANWQFMNNDASGTASKIDLGASFARSNTDRNKMFEVSMFCAPNTSTIYYECTDLGTGAVASGSVVSDLPVNTTLLSQKGYTSVGGTSSVVGYMLSSLYIETDL